MRTAAFMVKRHILTYTLTESLLKILVFLEGVQGLAMRYQLWHSFWYI